MSIDSEGAVVKAWNMEVSHGTRRVEVQATRTGSLVVAHLGLFLFRV